MIPALLLGLVATPPASVLVVPVNPVKDADEVLAASLQGPIESALEAVPELRVTSARDVKIVLAAHRDIHTVRGAPQDDAQAELLERVGETFSGEYVLKPELGRAGDEFTLSLALLRIRDAQSVARFSSGPVSARGLLDSVGEAVQAIRTGYLAHEGAVPGAEAEAGPGWGPYAMLGAGAVGVGAGLGLGFTAVADESVGRARAADATLWVSAGVVAAGVGWLIYALSD